MLHVLVRMRIHHWLVHVVFTLKLVGCVVSSLSSYKNPATKAPVNVHASLFHPTCLVATQHSFLANEYVEANYELETNIKLCFIQ